MIDEKQATQKATRPASRWRNLILPLRDFITKGGLHCRIGEEAWGEMVFPSRDIAETSMEKWMADYPGDAKYLGAFPVGD